MTRALILSLIVGTVAIAAIAIPPTRRASAEPPEYWIGVRGLTCPDPGLPEVSVDAFFAIPPLLRENEQNRNRFGLPGVPDAMWVDLTLFDNGFAPGTFLGLQVDPPLAGASFLTWHGLKPGAMHYYRINARVNGDWYALTTDRFETPDCQNVTKLECGGEHPWQLAVTFRLWRPLAREDGRPVDTWLDLTLRPDGFPAGTFVSAGPFASPALPDNAGLLATFEWQGIAIGWRHYWRTNVYFDPAGWITLRQGSFLALGCNTLLRTV